MIDVSDQYPDARNHNSVALEASACARTKRVPVITHAPAWKFEVLEAMGQLPAPILPERSLQQVLKIGLENRVSDTMEHLVWGKLS